MTDQQRTRLLNTLSQQLRLSSALSRAQEWEAMQRAQDRISALLTALLAES